MERSDLTDDQYAKLLNAIFPILLKKGPSHTTMDLVASCLSMSKRTLYEIFGSKDEMMRSVLEYHHSIHRAHIDRIFQSTENAMEGMAKVISYNQKLFNNINAAFFRDMDERSKHMRHEYDCRNRELNAELDKVFALGIRQGVFRKSLDYKLQLMLLRIQLESLKRMEEFFPPEISIGQAYNAIAQGFLRSIATAKGIEILETLDNNTDNDN